MLTKTVTINEEEMYNHIVSNLDKKYTLAYTDYRDSVPADIIQKCFDHKSNSPLYEEDVYSEVKRGGAIHVVNEILQEKYTQDQIDLFHSTDEYIDAICEVKSRDDSNPEESALRNTVAYGYLRFHSNYDCYIPPCQTGDLYCAGSALTEVMAALSLNPKKVKMEAIRQGLKVTGPFKDVSSRNGKEVVDYTEFVRSLIETPNYGNWSFFGRLNFRLLYNGDFNTDNLTIPKGTLCSMYNWWNGGGAMDFCETIRDVSVKEIIRTLSRYKACIKVVVDDKQNKKYGYTPSDVYGCHLSEKELFS